MACESFGLFFYVRIMKKIYYLKTCDSCRKLMKQFDFSEFEKQEIKANPITELQLEELKDLVGNYDELFSRRAKKYTELGLKSKSLSENEIKEYILSDYTFLKRPVIVDGSNVFIGSDKKNQLDLETHFSK